MTDSNYWSRFWDHRISRRRLIRGAALGGAGLTAAAVIGCGDEDEGTTGTSPGGSPGAAQSAGEPKRGGTLKLAVNEPPNWDIALNSSAELANISTMAYARMVRFARTPPEDISTWEPYLARSIEHPDPETYVFKLAPNAKHSPKPPMNGRAITADDVRLSLEYCKANNFNLNIQNKEIQSISAPDPQTVTIKLNSPVFAFIENYFLDAYGFYFIPVQFAETGDSKTTASGGETGPFLLKEYRPGNFYQWEKNPNYWDAEHIYVDGHEHLIILDASTRTAAFRSKQIDTTTGYSATIAPQDVPTLKKDLGDQISVYQGFSSGMSGKTWDMGMPEVADVRVRRAFAMVYNWEANESRQEALTGGPVRWNSHITGALKDWWLDPKSRNAEYGENGKYFKYNPEEARRMLEAAGWPFDKEFPFIVQTAQAASEAWAPELQNIGIKIKQEILPLPQYYAKVFTGQHFGSLANHLITYATIDPDLNLIPIYFLPSRAIPNSINSPMASDTEMELLISKEFHATTREDRQSALNELQVHLAGVWYHLPTISANPAYIVHHNNVKNLYPKVNNHNFTWGFDAWLDT